MIIAAKWGFYDRLRINYLKIDDMLLEIGGKTPEQRRVKRIFMYLFYYLVQRENRPIKPI